MLVESSKFDKHECGRVGGFINLDTRGQGGGGSKITKHPLWILPFSSLILIEVGHVVHPLSLAYNAGFEIHNIAHHGVWLCVFIAGYNPLRCDPY